MVDSAQALDLADDLRRQGKLVEAEKACADILKTEPTNAEAHYLSGLIAFENKNIDLAASHMAQAVAAVPEDPDFHCSLGNAQYMQGDLVGAADSFQQAINLNPTLYQAHANLGLVLLDGGQSADAVPVLEKALSIDPDNIDVLINLGNALQELDQFDNSITYYRRVIAIAPDYVAAHRNLGNVLSKAGQLDSAEEAYRNCLRLEPQFTEAYTDLGLVLVANGKLDEAAKHFIEPVRAFRAIAERPLETFNEFNQFNKTKLQHDIVQLEHLIKHKKISNEYTALPQDYRDVLAQLGDRYEGRLSELQTSASPQLLKSYNRILYHEASARIEGGALSPDLNAADIEKKYLDNPNGFTSFDGLLRDEALQSLRAFCLNSTVWSLFDYEDELEANLLTGFSSPLIFQIAADIKKAFPNIIGSHPFTSCWAYKYFKNKSGLGVHCDDGAVSINFWITPDQANNNPNAGGLVLWNKKVSRDYLGEMTEQKQQQFQQVIAEPDAQSFRVPYRCNRAVLFNSNVLHGTDTIDFKPGYENNRINMTFLYGKSPKAVTS